MQKLMMLAVLVAGLSLTFPIPSGADPRCVVDDDTGQTTCVVNVTGHGNATDCEASDEAFTTIQDAIDFLSHKEGLHYPPDGPVRLILVCPGTYSTGGRDGARVNIRINAISIIARDPVMTQISGAFSSGFNVNAHRVVAYPGLADNSIDPLLSRLRSL
jgi:hypothetical protein